MSELLELDRRVAPPGVGAAERRARADLRRQIGRLERELAGLFTESFCRAEIECGVGGHGGGPRILGLGELELVRDELATRVGEARLTLDERTQLETDNRELLERMLADPASFRWTRVSRQDVGEPGCGGWHSRPRFGLLGMLIGWWRVKVSSGCPLSGRLAAVSN
ncbi:MAG: hypothetical protein WB507_00815 [Solirubrobacterales bacterium]